MKIHEWRGAKEDGVYRYYRASVHGGVWTLKSTLKTDAVWYTHSPITLEEYRLMYDALWPKYQRNNIPWKDLEVIKKAIHLLESKTHSRKSSSPQPAEPHDDSTDSVEE